MNKKLLQYYKKIFSLILYYHNLVKKTLEKISQIYKKK